MKSQSTIIGRTVQGQPSFSGIWKEVKYRCRYWSEELTFASVFLVVGVVLTGLIIEANAQGNHDNWVAAQQHHFKVGSTAVCNMDKDPDTHNTGWQKCQIVSASKDNTYYVTRFWDSEKHRDVTFNFQNKSLGVK